MKAIKKSNLTGFERYYLVLNSTVVLDIESTDFFYFPENDGPPENRMITPDLAQVPEHNKAYHAEIVQKWFAEQEYDMIDGWRDKEKFIEYLEGQLIPDLKADGKEATAADFETAVKFMKQN